MMLNFLPAGLQFDGVMLKISGMPGFYSGAFEGKP
jgi:hypothetical protein